MHTEHNDRLNLAAAGLTMAAAAAMTVVAMAHHPSGGHGGQGALNTLVHGGMMALLSLIFVGFAAMSAKRGIGNVLVLAGLIAYGASVAFHLGAATINGFIVPSLAARTPQPVHDIFLLAWEANQALARLGVFATGAAYVLWSLDFLRGPGLTTRIVALGGFAAGILPALALTSGFLEMDVHGAFAVYSAHAVWAILVGVQLVRGKV